MIRMIGASTAEIDDPRAALSDILGQLNLDDALLCNSVGIVSCHSDFLETGVLEELCGNLPFDVVGTTTLGSSSHGKCGVELLSLSIITADDVSFSTAYSEPITEDFMREPVEEAYERALAGLRDEPRFALVFSPCLKTVSGESIMDVLDERSGGLPLFGAVACDHTLCYDEIKTFAGGESRSDSLGLVLIGGNIKPRFFYSSVSESRTRKQNAIITESHGRILRRVNNIPLMKYLTAQGLTSGCVIRAFGSIPFLVDFNDGTKPAARAISGITEEGYAACDGLMPVGAVLTIGSIDGGDILKTAESTVREAALGDSINGMLVFSCFVRCLMLGPNPSAEMRSALGVIGDKAPCHISYAGGEICPACGSDGRTFNRFHNFSCTVCVF
ncbi:MAG: FIST C-terminal domain-containing protein [Synergistaceae bacterium]|jgi:hypothetical protein|nr:FIST C-terminal domain-containing protein [Synergistaceae bacterium]